jgi:hypothetical protein
MSRTEQVKPTEVQTAQGRITEDVNKLKTLPDFILDYPEDFMNDLIKSVEHSYKKYGKLGRPIIISKDRYILDGNAVSLAAKRLGIQYVDVYELPVTCSSDPAVCKMWYDILNRVNRAQKDRAGTVARRKAVFELVLRYLANLPEDSYAELMQEMQNDTVPAELINFTRNLAPLPYGTVYNDLTLFIVHPMLFRAMVRVRNEDVKKIMASISDTVFALSLSDIDRLREMPREEREKSLNANGSVKEPPPRIVSPPPPQPVATPSMEPQVQQLQPPQIKDASRELPKPPASQPTTQPQASDSKTSAQVVTSKDGEVVTEEDVKAYLRLGEMYLEYAKHDLEIFTRKVNDLVKRYVKKGEYEEDALDKALDSLSNSYIVYSLYNVFNDRRLDGLRIQILKELLSKFESIMYILAVYMRFYSNEPTISMLIRIIRALQRVSDRVMGGPDGPRAMVPWVATAMCELMKTLDSIEGGTYKDGVNTVCKDVEGTILKKYDALHNR